MNTKISQNKVKLSNGEQISFIESGSLSSKVLLMIHGAYMSSEAFTDHIVELAKTFRVIAVDLRGHGNSSFVTPPNSLYDFVEDIHELINTLKLQRFSIFGWSTGGGIAMAFAAKYPQFVERIILYGSIGAQGNPTYQVDEDGALTQKRATTKEEVLNHPWTKMVDQLIEAQDRETADMFLKASLFKGKTPTKALERIVDSFLKCKCNGYLQYALNTFNITNESNGVTNGTGEIFAIKCPVLILHGQKDKVINVKEANLLKGLFKDQATLKIYPEGGHALIEEYPEEILSLIKGFVSPESILSKSKL